MSAAQQDDEPRDRHDWLCPIWHTHDQPCACRDDSGHAPYLVPEAGSLAARLDLILPLPCQLDETDGAA